jgi:hypothetical protein
MDYEKGLGAQGRKSMLKKDLYSSLSALTWINRLKNKRYFLDLESGMTESLL